MTLLSSIRKMAASLGIHVERRSAQPDVHLLGLRRLDFDRILDIGANRGQFARDARRWFPAAHLICFEPTAEAFAALADWARRDGNAEAHQLALGEEDGSTEMHLHVEHSPSSSLLSTTSECHDLYPQTQTQTLERVDIKTLDGFVAEKGTAITHRTLLKLDVQGYEAFVLRGGPKTLAACGACIVEVCLLPLYGGQGEIEQIIYLAKQAGLTYSGNLSQVYGPAGDVQYIDAVFTRR